MKRMLSFIYQLQRNANNMALCVWASDRIFWFQNSRRERCEHMLASIQRSSLGRSFVFSFLLYINVTSTIGVASREIRNRFRTIAFQTLFTRFDSREMEFSKSRRTKRNLGEREGGASTRVYGPDQSCRSAGGPNAGGNGRARIRGKTERRYSARTVVRVFSNASHGQLTTSMCVGDSRVVICSE